MLPPLHGLSTASFSVRLTEWGRTEPERQTRALEELLSDTKAKRDRAINSIKELNRMLKRTVDDKKREELEDRLYYKDKELTQLEDELSILESRLNGAPAPTPESRQ